MNPTTPNISNDEGRVKVENVKLSFDKEGNAGTRIDFDATTGLYSWQDGDKIGALLMDELFGTDASYRPYSDPAEWAQLTWTEKYTLSNYIHTDYPFIYKEADKTWNSDAAMLEGNYFFVSPYEGYNSKRQLVHSLADQKQADGSLDATEAAFGKNQYWIGYAQIKEGNKTAESLKTVEMTRVLAPIRFTIKMIGTQTYKVNKITVQGTDVRTLLTIDPTCDFNLTDNSASVGYKGKNGQGMYNLEDGGGTDKKHFNYANYLYALGDNTMMDEVYDHTKLVTAENNRVFNIDDETNYDRFDALRAIVDVESVKGDEVQYAQMSYDTEAVLKDGAGVVNGVIFVNPDAAVTDLRMSIYTDKGVIKDIDLTTVNTETDKALGKTTVITDKAISKLAPNVSNTINIQVDDNSVDAADVLVVNNDNDLKQFIDWNSSKNRPYLVRLANNATLTKDMVETLRAAKKANADNQLIVTNADAATSRTLTIAEDVAADVLEYVSFDGEEFDYDHDGTLDDITSVNVVILGTVNLNSDKAVALPNGTYNASATAASNKSITVAEGAVLNIEKANTSKLLWIENYGTIGMGDGNSAKNVYINNHKDATMNIAGQLEFAQYNNIKSTNEGTIKVAVTGELQGTTDGNFENKGLIENSGKIWNVANANDENAIVKTNGQNTTNHFASNGTNATIQLGTLKDPITGTYTGGHILYEGADVILSDATAAEVTDLVITNGYLYVEDTAAPTVKTITVKEGNTVTIEGGSFTGTAWKASSQKLNVATGAIINLSGTVTMNYLTSDIKADVNVLKGSLSINKDKVECVQNLTLGSKEFFTEYAATVNVAKGATLTVAGDLNTDADIQNEKSIINNNGTISVTGTKTLTYITVNGNAIP